jgi:hypothetical protein
MMNNRLVCAAALLTALSIASAWPAFADLPLGDQQVTLNGATTKVLDLSAPLSVQETGSAYGLAATSPSGAPYVTATARTDLGSGNAVSARAGLDYWIRIDGPAYSGTIPVFYSSDLSVSANHTPDNAFAEFILQSYNTYGDGSPFQNLTNQSWDVTAIGDSTGVQVTDARRVSGVFQLGFGDVLAAGIVADVSSYGGGEASAFADPYFYIDPTFLAANPGYSVVLSPFAGNDPIGAPEPASWAVMVLGFAGLGAVLRGRRREAVS